ncbi:MAG: 5'/3'-nucleotidase SurE [Alphaproteobacteria bacterium]|nr:5'/3'-nucleotidase SurE [Alphaproteobacteria bacterium]
MASSSLSKLRILITNDDSINASGIKALERIANSITPDVWVVAPEVGQSGKGYSVTFDNVLRIKEISPRKFSVDGTPADCIFVALGEILKDKKPDLVLSGINHGSNIGDFIGLSGTVGAAFAAGSQNIKAIAVSQDFSESTCPVKFPIVEHYLHDIIKKLLSFEWPEGVCMNVNFPDETLQRVKGVRIATQGKMNVAWNVHKRLDPVNHPYYWLRATYTEKENALNSDLMLLEQGKYVTITPLQSRHEYSECSSKLEELFESNV